VDSATVQVSSLQQLEYNKHIVVTVGQVISVHLIESCEHVTTEHDRLSH